MERLIDLISQVENDDSISESGFLLIIHPLINEIKSIASTLLITDDGKCNWQNIEILMDNSIEVFPVELDKFGWVLGGIRTTKGIITYG